jgi:hypothetical protein
MVIATVDVPGSPPDITPRHPAVTLKPEYKSGLVVRPEKNVTTYASGILVDAQDKPIPWAFGIVIDKEGTALGEVFTDDTGFFEAYSLSQGEYIIRWETDESLSVSFAIHPEDAGLVDLGRLAGAPAGGEE